MLVMRLARPTGPQVDLRVSVNLSHAVARVESHIDIRLVEQTPCIYIIARTEKRDSHMVAC